MPKGIAPSRWLEKGVACLRDLVEIDGAVVGPPFDDDEEEAHRWVAHHHPGTAFTIVKTRDDHAAVRVRYPPVVE